MYAFSYSLSSSSFRIFPNKSLANEIRSEYDMYFMKSMLVCAYRRNRSMVGPTLGTGALLSGSCDKGICLGLCAALEEVDMDAGDVE